MLIDSGSNTQDRSDFTPDRHGYFLIGSVRCCVKISPVKPQQLKMKRLKSKLGLVLSCAYLVGAAVIINETRCRPADWFLCGRSLGAMIVALPWTYPFLGGYGELYALIAVSVAGIP